QGTLQRTRSGLQGSPPAPPPPPPGAGPTPGPNKSDDPAYGANFSGAGEALAGLVLVACVAATSPFWAPFVLLEDSFGVPTYFPGHPYALGGNSYPQIDTSGLRPWHSQTAEFPDRDYLKPWAVRLTVEEGNDFAGLNRLGGRLTLDTTWRVGLA